VVACRCLAVALRRGAPVFPFVGKFIIMRRCCEFLVAARAASRCENDLSMESCLVALSTTRGEGLSREGVPIGVEYDPLVRGDRVI
jgi:hypothetical protein